jgi:hypothetical protein
MFPCCNKARKFSALALGDSGSAAKTEVEIKTNMTIKDIFFMSSPPFPLK